MKCPVGESDGIYPDCKCEFGGYFDEVFLECITCPEDSTGQYPDCICNDHNTGHDKHTNSCKKCKYGFNGIFPNCTCPDGVTYEEFRDLCVPGCVWANNGNGSMDGDYCMMCPGLPYDLFISTGNYPNCTCKSSNSVYDELSNRCDECPPDSTGIYPNCSCKYDGTYDKMRNVCLTCNPADSTGVYPKCICRDPASTYIIHLDECYACPRGSIGRYPNCKCNNGFYIEELNHCIECPTDASGVYPHCQCFDANLIFSAYINRCYHQCPDNSSGIHPDCQCEIGYHYDVDDKACRNNTGAMCPPGTNGIGPDCSCMDEYEIFDSLSWGCVGEYSETSGVGFPMFCPDGNGKWPQCGTSIDFHCVLQSCVG